MQRTLGQDIPNRMERKMFLQDNCDAVEDLGYVKEIPSERLEELKEVLVENNIELRSLREAKKEAVKEFNEQIKPLEEINAQTTKQLKERSEYVNEQCYKFVDNEERTVGTITPKDYWYSLVLSDRKKSKLLSIKLPEQSADIN